MQDDKDVPIRSVPRSVQLGRLGLFITLLGLADMIGRDGSTWLGTGNDEKFFGAVAWALIATFSIISVAGEAARRRH